MLTVSEIQSKHQHLSVRNRSLYLPINFAFDFLSECNTNDLLVLGIECFIHHGNEVVEAQTDLIADHSYIYSSGDTWASRRQMCNAQAYNFLTELPNRPNLVAEFVIVAEAGPHYKGITIWSK